MYKISEVKVLNIFISIITALILMSGCGATNIEKKTTVSIDSGALAGQLMSGAVAGAAVGGLAARHS